MSRYPLPLPGLEFLAHLEVRLAPPVEVGTGPLGRRRIIPIAGGDFAGPRMRGHILAGGADWQIAHPDGAIIDTRYTLCTDDGAYISISTRGVRCGNPETLRALAAGEDVDPSTYYFRVSAQFETGASAYSWLNWVVAVGAAQRSAETVRYDAYVVT